VNAASAPGKAAAVGSARKTATVTAVDQAARVVTLREADGTVTKFTAGPEVRNLEQTKVGDIVTLEYTQALALELKKSGTAKRERTETEGAMRAAPGQKPGGVMGREIRAVADVTAVDTKAKTVTLKGPQRTVTLNIEDQKQLADIKVGDQVEVTFIEAVALKVEAAKPAGK